MGTFYSFLRLLSRIFRCSEDFWRIFAKNMSCWRAKLKVFYHWHCDCAQARDVGARWGGDSKSGEEEERAWLRHIVGSSLISRACVAWTNSICTGSHQSKLSSSKKVTCKRTLRQVFIRVYRLELQSVMLVFCDPALWTVAPLTFSLVQCSHHPPCENNVYTYTVCVWGGVGGIWASDR